MFCLQLFARTAGCFPSNHRPDSSKKLQQSEFYSPAYLECDKDAYDNILPYKSQNTEPILRFQTMPFCVGVLFDNFWLVIIKYVVPMYIVNLAEVLSYLYTLLLLSLRQAWKEKGISSNGMLKILPLFTFRLLFVLCIN